jgi:hypothetical protein
LVAGIANGASAVVGAVTDLASKAKNGFTSFFQINSPSKLMMKVGDAGIAGGMAGGIQAGTSDVVAATTNMAKAAAAPVEAIAAPKGTASSLTPALAAPAINAPSLNAGMPDMKAPVLAPSPAAPLTAPTTPDARGPSIDPNAFANATQPPASAPVATTPSPASSSGASHTFNIEINGANKSLEDISLEALSAAFEQAAMHAAVE